MRRLVVPGSALLLLLAATASCRLESAAQGSANASPLSPGDLDYLLAPVALYPDSLLAQILLSAGTPAKVSELSTWLAQNKSLKGTDLQDAATKAGFEPSFVALALFPQVVTSMASKLDWTTRLGQAFVADRNSVFASVQRLRAQAQNSGALKDTPQQAVESVKTETGETVIVIEPANPQIVYVPQYDPQVVYVQEDNSANAAVAGLIGFTAGIAIGASMDNNYYYGPYGMHGGFHMYNGAYNDWYDHREDAREDWIDHRENLYEERGDQRSSAMEQRTDRQENRLDSGTASQAQRTDRQQNRQETRPATQTRNTTAQNRSAATASNTSRTYGGGTRQATTADRSGTRSDAFSGYSSGKSERAASARGSSSRGSSRPSGGGGGGGGRRR